MLGTSSVPRITIRGKAKQYLSKIVCVLSRFNIVRLFATLWTRALQVPLFMGFSRQESWSVLPCPPPGDLPDPGLKPAPLRSPALASGFFTTSTTWEVHLSKTGNGKNNNKEMVRDFLGGPVVKTSLSNAWVWVQSLVGKLRSPMPLGQKKQNIQQQK